MLTVDQIDVQVVRKKIKNLRLTIHPSDGFVRVSAPHRVSDEYVRLFIESRFNWIVQKQNLIAAQPRQPVWEYVSGETHYFFGSPNRLEVIEQVGKSKVLLKEPDVLQMFVKPDVTVAKKATLLNDWYREELKSRIPGLLEKWQSVIGENISDWGIKKMKTRWGSCNIIKRRIWLNLELAKKPLPCLEYVVVHEMVHLLERYHNARFYSLMDKFLPDWRQSKEMLNKFPLIKPDLIV